MNGPSESSKALLATERVALLASPQFHLMGTTTALYHFLEGKPLAGEAGMLMEQPLSINLLLPSTFMMGQPVCRKSVMEMYLYSH